MSPGQVARGGEDAAGAQHRGARQPTSPPPRRTHRRTTTLALLLVATAGLAQTEGTEAEAVAVDEPQLIQRELIVVEGKAPLTAATASIGAKLPAPLEETPASISVATRASLDAQGSRTLSDALSSMPGVNVQSQSGVHDYFLVRGFDSLSAGLVLTDGAPEPEATFYHLYNVDRVELLRGPGGFLYGGAPLAGTANLVRKAPLTDRRDRVTLSTGSFGTLRGEVDLNHASDSGRLAFRLNGMWQDSDGYREGKESRAVALNPTVTWRFDGDRSLTLNLEAVDNESTPDSGLPLIGTTIADVPRRRSYDSPFDFSDQQVSRLRLDYSSPLGERGTLRNKTYLTSLDWRSDGTLPTGVFPGAAGLELSRLLGRLNDRQDFLGNQLEAILPFGDDLRHEILVGLEVGRYDDTFTFDLALLPTIDVFDPVETAVAPGFTIPGQSRAADARTTVVAPYVADRISFDDHWQLWLGARFDRLDQEEAIGGLQRTDSQLSPFVGLAFTPRPALTLYANAGQAFGVPSSLAGGERTPEESEQLEVGAKTSLADGKLRGNLALYQLERQNIAIPDATGVTATTGDQRSRGFELELTATPTESLTVLASYAYNDAELTEFRELGLISFFPPTFGVIDYSGNTPSFAPEQLARIWIHQQLAGGFSVSGGVRFVDDQFVDEDNLARIDAAWLVDAGAAWQRQRLRLRLALRNLTGKEFEVRGSNGLSVIPGDGFAAHASVEVAF